MVKLKKNAEKETKRAILAVVSGIGSYVILNIDPATGGLANGITGTMFVIGLYKVIEALIHQYWDDE